MRSAGAAYGLENGFLEGALLFPPTSHFIPSGPTAGQYNLADGSKLPAWRDRYVNYTIVIQALA
eukprot:COSAG02_NODE_16332_length_1092_cov_1.282981_2_plen_63_part_01